MRAKLIPEAEDLSLARLLIFLLELVEFGIAGWLGRSFGVLLVAAYVECSGGLEVSEKRETKKAVFALRDNPLRLRC